MLQKKKIANLKYVYLSTAQQTRITQNIFIFALKPLQDQKSPVSSLIVHFRFKEIGLRLSRVEGIKKQDLFKSSEKKSLVFFLVSSWLVI